MKAQHERLLRLALAQPPAEKNLPRKDGSLRCWGRWCRRCGLALGRDPKPAPVLVPRPFPLDTFALWGLR